MSAVKEKREKKKNVEKLESLFIADRNVKQCSYYGNQLAGCSEELMMELSYDLAILLKSINPKELKERS